MNSGCLAGNARVDRGGTDRILHLPPADGSFNGVFSAVQFLTPSADRFDLFLAATNGVLNVRCETDKAGTKFTRLAESSVRVVLSNGNVLEIQTTPQPPATIRTALRGGDWTALKKLAENKKGEAELRAWAYYQLGSALSETNLTEAAARFLKALELCPNNKLGLSKDMIRLAAQRRLVSIDRNGWATPAAQKLFVRLHEACPDATDQADYALACWSYWSSGKLDGVCETFRRLGCGRELALAAAKAGDLVELRRLAENSVGSEAGRATAWHELAKQADRKDQRAEAAAAYLKTLENCAVAAELKPLRDEVWRTIRDRLDSDITREQYAVSLNTLASKSKDQVLLEEIVFELGKLRMLQTLPGGGARK
jgi:hypothetical protein